MDPIKRSNSLKMPFIILLILLALIGFFVFHQIPKSNTIQKNASINAETLAKAITKESLLELSKNYPNEAKIFEKLGEIYEKEHSVQDAIKNYERACQLDYNNPAPYNKLYEIYSLLGEKQKAAEYCAESIAIDPRQVEMRVNLSTIYLSQGRLNEALGQLNEALKIEPSNRQAKKMFEDITKKRR